MLSAKKQSLFQDKILTEYSRSKAFRRALAASNLAKIQAKVDHYRQFSNGKIDRLPFQERAIKSACALRKGLWCGELWTGAGKSIIAARAALHFLRLGGKVIFICPNRMGIGNISDGIIQKFHRTFAHFKGDHFRIGELDNVTRLDDVHFFTPHAFVSMSRNSPALFKKLVSECSLLIVDEAHHFPEDPQEEQIIYGKIERLASRYFLDQLKKVITLTATHGRHDGKPVFKKERPDFQITVNEAVQAGWCPEIHGLPVYLKTKAPRAVSRVTDYELNLSKQEQIQYLREVAAVMLEVQKQDRKQQFCAFVRTIPEARKLFEIWNHEAPRFGFLPVVLLIGTMSIPERMAAKASLQAHEASGYITCDVGSESIDIPRMETIHLIRRTRSINRLIQSVGRILRNHPEKRRALIVDYHLSEKRIIRACKGLEAYAAYVKSPEKKPVSGGPLVPILGSKNADFSGITLKEERKWIERSLSDSKFIKAGRVFRWLTVIEDDGFDRVLCRCKCGKTCHARRDRLLDGTMASCGCYKHTTALIKEGTRFGRLTVLRYQSSHKVICKCDCGKETITSKGNLIEGTTKSCGCLRQPHGPLPEGKRFGKLVVLHDHRSYAVTCLCDCGKTILTSRNALKDYSWKAGRKSCGCHLKRQNIKLRRGSRFKLLKVLRDNGTDNIECLCDCGNRITTTRAKLRNKDARSCGCFRIKQVQEISKKHKKHRTKISFQGSKIRLKPGSQFNYLTVIEDKRCDNVICKCRCGKIRVAQRTNLLHGRTKSCGCAPRGIPLKKGSVYNLLRVISDDGAQSVTCKCKCGKVVVRARCALTTGNTKSCGCLNLGDPLRKGRRFGKLKVLEDRGARNVLCLCDCGRKAVKIRGQLGVYNNSCGCLAGKPVPPVSAGQKFGRWTALKASNEKRVLCRCVCGTERLVHRKHLQSGNSKGCGCPEHFKALKVGRKFGSLIVLKDLGFRKGWRRTGKPEVRCKCICGKERVFGRSQLLWGVKSCGCLRRSDVVRPGTRIGKLLVIKDNGYDKVSCVCDCGKKVIMRRTVLNRKIQKSCGCMYTTDRRLKPGSRYGEWTILNDTGARYVTAKCSCGFLKKNHYRPNLTGGLSKRCYTCGLRENARRLRLRNRGMVS